jgi:hypothetical protein
LADPVVDLSKRRQTPIQPGTSFPAMAKYSFDKLQFKKRNAEKGGLELFFVFFTETKRILKKSLF